MDITPWSLLHEDKLMQEKEVHWLAMLETGDDTIMISLDHIVCFQFSGCFCPCFTFGNCTAIPSCLLALNCCRLLRYSTCSAYFSSPLYIIFIGSLPRNCPPLDSSILDADAANLCPLLTTIQVELSATARSSVQIVPLNSDMLSSLETTAFWVVSNSQYLCWVSWILQCNSAGILQTCSVFQWQQNLLVIRTDMLIYLNCCCKLASQVSNEAVQRSQIDTIMFKVLRTRKL